MAVLFGYFPFHFTQNLPSLKTPLSPTLFRFLNSLCLWIFTFCFLCFWEQVTNTFSPPTCVCIFHYLLLLFLWRNLMPFWISALCTCLFFFFLSPLNSVAWPEWLWLFYYKFFLPYTLHNHGAPLCLWSPHVDPLLPDAFVNHFCSLFCGIKCHFHPCNIFSSSFEFPSQLFQIDLSPSFVL